MVKNGKKPVRYVYHVDAAGVKVIRGVQEKYHLGSRGASAALRIILHQYAEFVREHDEAKTS